MTTCIWLVLPRYMAEAVWLQRVVGSDWVPLQTPRFPTCPSVLSTPTFPGPGSGPQPQPLGLDKPGKGPPGSGEAAVLQEVSVYVCVCVLGEGVCRLWVWGEAPPVLSWP